jgi:hypothetical protein
MICDLTNTPIEMTIAGRQIKVKRLSIGEFFGIAESAVRQQYINNIQTIASMLSGKEKMDYLSQATREIPKGDELHQSALAYLNSPQGIAILLSVGLNKLNKLSDEDISALILAAKEGEVQYVVQYMVGIDSEKAPSEAPEETEKKTL